MGDINNKLLKNTLIISGRQNILDWVFQRCSTSAALLVFIDKYQTHRNS